MITMLTLSISIPRPNRSVETRIRLLNSYKGKEGEEEVVENRESEKEKVSEVRMEEKR